MTHELIFIKKFAKVDEVRKAVAENPNVSKSDLLILASDDDIGVRFVAKERLNKLEPKTKSAAPKTKNTKSRATKDKSEAK